MDSCLPEPGQLQPGVLLLGLSEQNTLVDLPNADLQAQLRLNLPQELLDPAFIVFEE